MRKILLAALALLAGLLCRAQTDTTGFSRLEAMVRNYTSAIAAESIESKENECVFLINSLDDPGLRGKLAMTLFDIYRNSPLMGDESVAIFIWDEWLKDRKIALPDDESYSDARMFAEFNRESQLGFKAPALQLRKPCGGRMTVPRNGRPAILYFYDTSCGKCKLVNSVISQTLSSWHTPVDFYAIYVGMDKNSWKDFRKKFHISNRKIRTRHLWDPDMETDMVRLYGVLATPKLYLINSDGRITGRRLELENLLQLEDYLD